MFILRDLLTPLQEEFSNIKQGQKRKVWFAYTLLAVVVPFTSSITSNLLRALQTLFGLDVQSQRFYTFMASTTLPWNGLWQAMWGMIPSPATEERIIVALDYSINPKSGRNHLHSAPGQYSSVRIQCMSRAHGYLSSTCCSPSPCPGHYSRHWLLWLLLTPAFTPHRLLCVTLHKFFSRLLIFVSYLTVVAEPSIVCAGTFG